MDDKKQSERDNSPADENRQVERNTTSRDFDAKDAKLVRWDQHVPNADNVFLEPWAAGPLTIGSVDGVNGPGAQEIPEFNATRHELLVLVKHYEEKALDHEYFCFLYATYGSDWEREIYFARRRIARIVDLLGEDTVRSVVSEVATEFAKKENPRAWQIFCHGTAEERRSFQDEVQHEVEESMRDKEKGGKD
jgi:hypothetical protein